MEQKNHILAQLQEEHSQLITRREELMERVDLERDEYEEDSPNPVLEDCINELQNVVEQIFKLECTIREIKASDKANNRKGEGVKVGDVVTLKKDGIHKQYYITDPDNYVNPGLGIISPNSPIGKVLLSSKFGEKICMQLNGLSVEYELAP